MISQVGNVLKQERCRCPDQCQVSKVFALIYSIFARKTCFEVHKPENTILQLAFFLRYGQLWLEMKVCVGGYVQVCVRV